MRVDTPMLFQSKLIKKIKEIKVKEAIKTFENGE